ncbi:hypothetical protein MNBD_PLANCTO02-857, partial [hydrothermal vent metagenome]
MSKRKKHRERERHNKKVIRRSSQVDSNQQRFEQTDLPQEETVQIESPSTEEDTSSPFIETEEKMLRNVSVTPVVQEERSRKKVVRKTRFRNQSAWKSV